MAMRSNSHAWLLPQRSSCQCGSGFRYRGGTCGIFTREWSQQNGFTREAGLPDDVLEEAIDLADFFRRPQLAYFHLSSTIAPGSAPALARFVTFFLLASATSAQRNVPVYLVIDEFQRMVARNFEYMLQLARSMGVRIILANQSMEDLKTSSTDLIPTIEANCRYRQWFSVSATADRDRLVHGSGLTIDHTSSYRANSSLFGTTAELSGMSESILSRLSPNDIILASDHPKHSIVTISRGAGYAQYGGFPFVCESDFHITADEYAERKSMRWPRGERGTFVPDEWKTQPIIAKPSGPVITTEIRNDSEDPFADFLNAQLPSSNASEEQTSSTEKPSRKKRGRR